MVENGGTELDTLSNGGAYDDDKYPSGEFVFRRRSVVEDFLVKTRLFFALPWKRFKSGSVLTVVLRGKITDQRRSSSTAQSLPQICVNFEKAAYDPRVAGIYLHIDNLKCGWGKLDEIRRQVLDFKKSGKFIIGYVPTCGVKEYYIGSACEELYAPPSAYVGLYGFTRKASFLGGVLEKVGVEAQVERIGKYKRVGDILTRSSMSDEIREMLTSLLDNIYNNWLNKISLAKGKNKEDIENFINEGVHQVERMKEEGFITDIKYDDEIKDLLKTRLGILSTTKKLPTVGYRKYCNVSRSTLGLTGSKYRIAIIRASGSISRTDGRLNASGSKIIAEKFIEKIRHVKESKNTKLSSFGLIALEEMLLLLISMSDVAASGGYHMAMAADAIVAEKLTLTGSIGVVTTKLNLGKFYEYIGFNEEIVSRGSYAELLEADNRPFRADEAELYSKRAQNAYKQFRDKAALSRSFTVEKMEEAAQGRVWSGHDAASLGLVDAIGGVSRAIAIAKQKANIPLDRKVTLVEMSKAPSRLKTLLAMGSTFVEADVAVKDLMHEMASSDAIQARMDGILLEKCEGGSYADSILMLLKDYLRSL